MSTAVDISLDGQRRARRRAASRRAATSIDFLRLDLGLMGSHTGCEHGVCGACTVRVDGKIVRGCLVLAASLDGAKVETIEGVSDTGEIRDLQEAFVARNACQCGYCTPAMLLTAAELLQTPTRGRRAQEIREHIVRQLLPLHRLPRHRRRGRDRRGQAQREGRAMNEIIDPRSVDRPNSYIGKSVPRPNAKKLVEGRGQYVDDVVLPRMVHVAFVRSPHAHAKIVKVDGARRAEDARRAARVHRPGPGRPLRSLGGDAGAPQGHEVGAAASRCRSSAPPGSARPWRRWWPKAGPLPRMPSAKVARRLRAAAGGGRHGDRAACPRRR